MSLEFLKGTWRALHFSALNTCGERNHQDIPICQQESASRPGVGGSLA